MPPREDYATAFSSKPNSVCIAPGGTGVFRSMLFEALSFSASLTKFRRRGFAPSCAGLACMHLSGCPAIMRRDAHYESRYLEGPSRQRQRAIRDKTYAALSIDAADRRAPWVPRNTRAPTGVPRQNVAVASGRTRLQSRIQCRLRSPHMRRGGRRRKFAG